jgi:hypothetical protein
MNRLSSRVVRLERASSGRYWWEGSPLEYWPDHALEALIGEGEGWPLAYSPSDDVLRAAFSGIYKDAALPGDGAADDRGEAQ